MTVSGRGKLVKRVVDTTTRDCWPAQVPAPRAVRGTGPPPAAAAPYELAEWRDAGVNIDFHVAVGHNYYSVPHQLVERKDLERPSTRASPPRAPLPLPSTPPPRRYTP